MLYRISRAIFEFFINVLFRVRIFGRENLPGAPYIVVPNHASLLDPPLVGVACKKDNISFMAKKELFDTPLVGAWTRAVDCICVRRGATSVRSLKDALKRVSAGEVVCVFPEGARSPDGSLQEAKRGVGFLIAKAGVPVVPIYIDGSLDAWPKGRRFRPGARINVFVGRPIPPDELVPGEGAGKKDYEAIANKVMDAISRLRESGTRC